MECAICMCNFTADGEHIPLGLSCGHTFGGSCLQRTMSSGWDVKCPTCRESINCPFEKIPKNYLALDILSSTKSEPSSLNACIRGSRQFVKETYDDITLRIDKLLEEMEAKRAANAARVAKISAMEKSIADLKRRLAAEETALAVLKADALSNMAEFGEHSPDESHLRRLRKLEKVAVSKNYMSESHSLCRDVMTSSFLAVYVPQINFDRFDLRAKILKIRARPDYCTRIECQRYVVSLLKLEYHYMFPSAANKFDIWSLLEMRMRLRSSGHYLYHHLETNVCETLINLHPDIPMQINFTDGKFLDVPLHSTMEWVSQEINRAFSVASSAVPLQLYCGYENLSAKRGKLFDLGIVAKTVFSLSAPKAKIEMTTLGHNSLQLKILGGQRLIIYEVKQLICNDTAPPHLLTISFNGVPLCDETTITVGFCNKIQVSGLHVAIRDNDVGDYMVFGDTSVTASSSPSTGSIRGIPVAAASTAIHTATTSGAFCAPPSWTVPVFQFQFDNATTGPSQHFLSKS